MLYIIFSIIITGLFIKSQPIVGYPISIQNQINISNPGSYGIYYINIYNPTNYTYTYSLYSLSSEWEILFNQNNTIYYGTLSPDQYQNITIYMRPYGIINQIPEIVVYLQNENMTTNHYSDIIAFTPTLYYVNNNINNMTENITKNITLPLNIAFQLSNTNVYQNQYLYLLGIIENPNKFAENLLINISSDFGYTNVLYEDISPGENVYQIPIYISNITPGNYYIYVNADNNIYDLAFNVTTMLVAPKTNVTSAFGYIKYIIYNPYNYPLNYTFYVRNVFGSFSSYSPSPQYYETVGRVTYGIYNLFILPGQEYIIVESINYYLIVVILLGILILLLLISYILFNENIEIKKEVSKIDMEKNLVDITINIKNKGLFSISNVKISEHINKPFKIKEYKIAEPSTIYKTENTYIVNWKFDNIKRNEEILLSYTLQLADVSDIKSIELPRTSITYNYLFWNKIKYSNGLIIRITK